MRHERSSLAAPLGSSLLLALAAASAGAQAQRWTGERAGAEFGRALATGDFDGDGFGDLAVGAPGFDGRGHEQGRVSVYLGSPSGLSSVPDWSATGEQPFAHFGALLSSGDVNGDGRDDLFVGAPDHAVHRAGHSLFDVALGHASARTAEGRVYAYLGTPGGLAAAPQRTLTGAEVGGRFGAALASAGDVNGDGRDDVLVGASGMLAGFGEVFLFAGSPDGLRAQPGWVRLGTAAGEGYGSVLGSAGDLDRDGFADFLLSAPQRGTSGAVEVFLGSAQGPAVAPDRTSTPGMSVLGPSASIDTTVASESFYLVGADPSAVRWKRLLGGGSGSYPGVRGTMRALAVGDHDGDGAGDVVVGTPDFEFEGFHGRVWTYLSLAGHVLHPSQTYPVFDGEQSGAEWGAALATIDVDGDGADELFIGAPRHDEGQPDEGLVVMEPGHTDGLELVETGPALTLGASSSGDFDGDGFDDLLTAEYAGSQPELRVRRGSSGGLPAAHEAVLDHPSYAGLSTVLVALTSGDFDGDGFADALATFTLRISGPFGNEDDVRQWFYLGSASGLASAPAVTLDEPGIATRVGDVNGDGRDDLALALTSGVALHLGTSAGLEAAPSQVLPGVVANGRTLLAGHLNGDALADVVLVRNYGALVEIWLGSPSGLVPQHQQTGLPNFQRFDFLTDVDGDGLDDLLVRTPGDFDKYRAYLGSPGGFTRAAQWWEDPMGPGSDSSFLNTPVKAVFDADGDGRADLLLGGNSLHRGSAQGVRRSPSWSGWSTEFTALGSRLGSSVTTGDFDGDGAMELLVQENALGADWDVVEFRPR